MAASFFITRGNFSVHLKIWLVKFFKGRKVGSSAGALGPEPTKNRLWERRWTTWLDLLIGGSKYFRYASQAGHWFNYKIMPDFTWVVPSSTVVIFVYLHLIACGVVYFWFVVHLSCCIGSRGHSGGLNILCYIHNVSKSKVRRYFRCSFEGCSIFSFICGGLNIKFNWLIGNWFFRSGSIRNGLIFSTSNLNITISLVNIIFGEIVIGYVVFSVFICLV